MDAALEEMWKKFHLCKEQKGVLAVNTQDVAISKQQHSLVFYLNFRLTRSLIKRHSNLLFNNFGEAHTG